MSPAHFVIVEPEAEISHVRFVALVAWLFPAVAADLLDEDEDGLPFMQVACLTRYANSCLAKDNLAEFERILRFVDYTLPDVDDRLDNALHVSFVETLDLDGDNPTREAALQLLSPWQLNFYVKIGEFYAEIERQKQATAAQQQAS